MAKRKRRKYSREFKEESVKLVTEQGCQVAEAARNLGIHANMLSRWKCEIEDGVEGDRGIGNLNDVQSELRRFRKENMRLKSKRHGNRIFFLGLGRVIMDLIKISTYEGSKWQNTRESKIGYNPGAIGRHASRPRKKAA